jgi:hypothetical protein
MNTKTPSDIPKRIEMAIPGDCIQFAQSEAEGGAKLPTFSMTAYSGGPIDVGFEFPVLVDLAGMKWAAKVPIRLNHSRDHGVGHAVAIEVRADKLYVSGVISRATPAAMEVVASGNNGFPWQASIGASIQRWKFIEEGKTVEANGKTHNGPLIHATKTTLVETSFVDIGADNTTTAKIAASHDKGGQTMSSEGATTVTLPAPAPIIEAAKPSDTSSMRDQIRAESLAEHKRIADIRKRVGSTDIEASQRDDIISEAIEKGWDADRAELHALRASRAPTKNINASMTLDQPTGSVVSAALCRAMGMDGKRIVAHYGADAANAMELAKLNRVGLRGLFEAACGQSLPNPRQDTKGFIRAAFSTMSLPSLLGATANKTLLDAYEGMDQTWRSWARVTQVNDFKAHTRHRMSGSFKFLPVAADGHIQHGTVSEQTFTVQADTYGRMFSITRQDIVNDDLGAFGNIAREIGMGAGESVADAAYTLLLANTGSFFATGNANYIEGAATNLQVTSLTSLKTTLMKQTKPNGTPIGYTPHLILVPSELDVTARTLLNSQLLLEAATAGSPKPANNPHVNSLPGGVVSTPYLSNSSYTGYSTTGWYLFFDPSKLHAFEAAFLNGVDTPTVESADADFDQLGIQMRGYFDFDFAQSDYRGGAFSKGAA